MKPLVSVLIPVYNAEQWVARAIESALDQTWPNVEIIAVNDGSQDKSVEILKGFESRGVKVIDQENRGGSTARNRALQESRGEYIQYLDADDFLSPDKIEEQIKVLLQNPPGMVAMSGAVYFYDGENPQCGKLYNTWPVVDSDDPLAWLIELLGPDGVNGGIQTGQWLVPRTVAQAAGLWNEQLSLDDDGEYFARVVLSSAGLRRCMTGNCYYRKFRTLGSVGSGIKEVAQWSALRSAESKDAQILSRTQSKRAKRALSRQYMTRAFQAYPEYPRLVNAALEHVNELGGDEDLLYFGSRKSDLIRRFFGWRLAKRASLWWHRHVPSKV